MLSVAVLRSVSLKRFSKQRKHLGRAQVACKMQMLKKKLPPVGADFSDKVSLPCLAQLQHAGHLLSELRHLWHLQVEDSSRSNSPLVIKASPAPESDWRLEEGDKPSRALQVVKELHARYMPEPDM